MSSAFSLDPQERYPDPSRNEEPGTRHRIRNTNAEHNHKLPTCLFFLSVSLLIVYTVGSAGGLLRAQNGESTKSPRGGVVSTCVPLLGASLTTKPGKSHKKRLGHVRRHLLQHIERRTKRLISGSCSQIRVKVAPANPEQDP